MHVMHLIFIKKFGKYLLIKHYRNDTQIYVSKIVCIEENN